MDHLLTEARNPASTELDRLTPLELVRLMNAEDARVIPAVAAQAEVIARAVASITERLRGGGRLVYLGAGTSGRLGVLDASECPPTFRSPPGQVVGLIAGGPTALTTAVEGAEDHPELGEQDLRAISLTAADAVVGIATSGRTPYVLGGLRHARVVGALTVGISCTPDAELNPLSDLAIPLLVGPEVLTGSTRLKAGTATKLVLNMLSTGAMVGLGKTFGNLMVDLRATNTKLRARSNRIVRHFTGLSAEEADALLARCDGELKTALVAHSAGLAPGEARERLQSVGGQVRLALGTSTAPPVLEGAADHLLLGIDGGGSHTVALLAEVTDAGWRVLGAGEAGPSNLQAAGAEAALRALDEATAAAFHVAGRQRARVTAACLGLSGAGRPADQEVLRTWAERVGLALHLDVTTDVALLLAAGTPEEEGIAVVAGTGSIVHGRAADGRTARAGGWGPLLGDEGSAYSLVLAALRAVARSADGRGPATALTERFLARLGLSSPTGLIPTVHGGDWDRPALAGLAPLVLQTAEDGDAVAATVVREGAAGLAAGVAAVCETLGLSEPPLVLGGGLLVGGERYRRELLDATAAVGVRIGPVQTVARPAEGALRRARDLLLSYDCAK